MAGTGKRMPDGKEGRAEWERRTTTFPAGKVARMVGGLPNLREELYERPHVEEGIKVKNFLCPVCGSKKYEPVRKQIQSRPGPIGPGNKTSYVVIGYECSGCSTTFEDPKRFSKNRK